ncbi:dihydroxy-acid dehydratase [Yoonia sp.]|uniref:dihydroxy-acid dehydratase n=1 Tax=Yoonia sp. TaxID=2212373 RepID=UPI0023B66A30
MKRASAVMVGVLAVTACTAPVSTRTVTLGDGTIAATSPTGYCVDTVASQPSRDFAVLAPCATLGGGMMPDVVGMATVQVGPADSGSIALDELALRDFLITDAGARLLSQSGDADDITILSTQAFSNQVMVYFADRGTPPIAGLQSQEWRAFREVDGRLVTIGVRGLAASPLKDGPGAALLKQIIAGVRPTAQPDDGAQTDV